MGLKGQFSQEPMTVCDSQRANMAKKKRKQKRNVCENNCGSEWSHIELLSSRETFPGLSREVCYLGNNYPHFVCFCVTHTKKL